MAITPLRTSSAGIPATASSASIGGGDYSGIAAAVAPAAAITPTAAPAGNLAYTDPTYLAFLRETGVTDAEAQGEAASRIARLNGRVEDMKPVYADRMRLGLRNISENAESQGMFRSGRRLEDQTQFQTDTNREHQSAINDIEDQKMDIGTSLAQGIASRRRQKSEEELAAEDRAARENAQYGIG